MGNFLKIFGIAMGIVYLAAGTFVIVSAGFLNLEPYQRILFGAIIIVYGLFRVYKVMRKTESELEYEDEEKE